MLKDHNLPVMINDKIFWNNYNNYGKVVNFVMQSTYKVVDNSEIHISYYIIVKDKLNNIFILSEFDEINGYEHDGFFHKDDLKSYDWMISLYAKYTDKEYYVTLKDNSVHIINSCKYKLNNYIYGNENNYLPLDYDFEYTKFATKSRVILESEIISAK